jgi:hypothetical protein
VPVVLPWQKIDAKGIVMMQRIMKEWRKVRMRKRS